LFPRLTIEEEKEEKRRGGVFSIGWIVSRIDRSEKGRKKKEKKKKKEKDLSSILRCREGGGEKKGKGKKKKGEKKEGGTAEEVRFAMAPEKGDEKKMLLALTPTCWKKEGKRRERGGRFSGLRVEERGKKKGGGDSTITLYGREEEGKDVTPSLGVSLFSFPFFLPYTSTKGKKTKKKKKKKGSFLSLPSQSYLEGKDGKRGKKKKKKERKDSP